MITYFIFAGIIAAAILIGCAVHQLSTPRRKEG